MKQIAIDADALFRAVSATGYKLLAYHLDIETGAIDSRTLRPDEVSDAPQGPSVAELPKLGGDLSVKKDAQPFGPPPVEGAPKKKLFADDEGPKKKFDGDFWKRESKKADPFAGDGFRRQNATKKLAEMFGGPPRDEKKELFAKTETPASSTPAARVSAPASSEPAPDDPRKPRIPVISEAQVVELMQLFTKETGDPQIKAEMMAALNGAKPVAAFERVLRKYTRTSQQYERYFRKQSLLFAETWLSELGIAWELIEKPDDGRS